VPVKDIDRLPSTSSQYKALKDEIDQTRPAVQDAKRKSDALKAQADELRRRLIATAARIQDLEDEKSRLDADIAQLTADETSLSTSFAADRVRVAGLLAVLERLQVDAMPVIAMRPEDALGTAHGAMLLGAAVPRLYGAAAELSHRLAVLKHTRVELLARRADSLRNANELGRARRELDQLLARKAQDADEAAERYSDLAAKFTSAADQAASLESLLKKVAWLRAQPANQSVVVVAAQDNSVARALQASGLQRDSLLRPVVGRMLDGDTEGLPQEHAPGVSFMAPPAAQVIAPADAQVLYAGHYHKTGQVLILHSAGGYDLVLAGLERIDVRSGDQLLAGEPIGNMPQTSAGARLYFELRQNGKGVNPAPWLEADLRKAKRS
jgi:septal ring factor EnvC (AmiA/AmiB activator)